MMHFPLPPSPFSPLESSLIPCGASMVYCCLNPPPPVCQQKAFYGCSHVCGFRKYFVMQRPERVLELELVAGIETKFSCKYNHGGAVRWGQPLISNSQPCSPPHSLTHPPSLPVYLHNLSPPPHVADGFRYRVSVAEGSEDAVAVAGGCSRLLHSLGVDPALLLDPEEVRRFLGASASTAPDHEAFLPLGRGVYEVLEKRLWCADAAALPTSSSPPSDVRLHPSLPTKSPCPPPHSVSIPPSSAPYPSFSSNAPLQVSLLLPLPPPPLHSLPPALSLPALMPSVAFVRHINLDS